MPYLRLLNLLPVGHTIIKKNAMALQCVTFLNNTIFFS